MRIEITPGLERRFWTKVAKTDDASCWLWTAAKRRWGYGVIQLDNSGGAATATRVAWTIANGPIPPDSDICHRCDNPPCVRPDHLFAAPHAANVQDMTEKRRHWAHTGHIGGVKRGSANAAARLTEEQVREVRQALTAGIESRHKLAARFGVSRPTIRRIERGTHWRHVQA
jgi:hypothetical protein